MDAERFGWSLATEGELPELLEMLEAFYVEEQLAHDPEGTSAAVKALVGDPSLGAIWLLKCGGSIAGYLIASIGFSVEFGGRYVLLDELFIRPEFRGHGQWRRGFAEVERWASEKGIGTLRLEVNHHNSRAKGLYLGYGFIDDERSILTKRLSC